MLGSSTIAQLMPLEAHQACIGLLSTSVRVRHEEVIPPTFAHACLTTFRSRQAVSVLAGEVEFILGDPSSGIRIGRPSPQLEFLAIEVVDKLNRLLRCRC